VGSWGGTKPSSEFASHCSERPCGFPRWVRLAPFFCGKALGSWLLAVGQNRTASGRAQAGGRVAHLLWRWGSDDSSPIRGGGAHRAMTHCVVKKVIAPPGPEDLGHPAGRCSEIEKDLRPGGAPLRQVEGFVLRRAQDSASGTARQPIQHFWRPGEWDLAGHAFSGREWGWKPRMDADGRDGGGGQDGEMERRREGETRRHGDTERFSVFGARSAVRHPQAAYRLLLTQRRRARGEGG
jgi:hypothetical protein